MIADYLVNAGVYENFSPRFKRGFDFLRQENLVDLAPGRYEIDGENVFATVSEYTTKPKEEGRWEAHRKYIDLQYLIMGTEEIGCAPITKLVADTEYDAEKDIIFFKGRGESLTLHAGAFMVFFPHDAHMPGLASGAQELVKKIVVKIGVE